LNERTPFEEMMARWQELARSMNPALETFNPRAMEAMWPTMPRDWMEMVFGNAWNKEGLDAKSRLLLTLAGLTMQGAQADSQIRITVRHLVEAIGMMSVFAGLPAMTRAMHLAQEALEEREDDGNDEA
jgi:4-carboxymuconolactone decarboxylase